MLTSFVLPRLGSDWQSNPNYFSRLWNQTMQTIETAINAINDVFQQAADAQAAADGAQSSADGAQTTANGAQSSATSAQTTATNALILAGTSVQKDQTPAWTAPSGVVARTALAGYTSPVISPVPTQVEVQAISDYLQALSRAECGLITDLRSNHALHN